jgi:putative solute:sodium symporter small subunit
MPSSDPTLDPPPDPGSPAARARHWRRTRGLTAVLLAAWFAVGFVVPWFARDLDFRFFGWPFGFWAAAQGGVIVFVALIAAYAARMRRLDGQLRASADAGEAAAARPDGGRA